MPKMDELDGTLGVVLHVVKKHEAMGGHAPVGSTARLRPCRRSAARDGVADTRSSAMGPMVSVIDALAQLRDTPADSAEQLLKQLVDHRRIWTT